MLAEEHPDLFAQAVEYEQNHSDGRIYTWTDGETLLELLSRKEQIISSHELSLKRELERTDSKCLSEALEKVLDLDGDELLPCLACHL